MPLLSLSQAARRWGVDTDALRREIREGRLRAQQDSSGRWWVESNDRPTGGASHPSEALERLEGRTADLQAEVAALRAELHARPREVEEPQRVSAVRSGSPGVQRRWWEFWRR